MAQPLNIALAYDAATRRCDVVVAHGQLALDATALTPMLLSLGLDRRALADDTLPDDGGDAAAPHSLLTRRGSALDALNAGGERAGSRLWLLARAKQSEATRQLAIQATQDALAWLTARYGLAVSVDANWVRRGVLGLAASAGGSTVAVQRGVG